MPHNQNQTERGSNQPPKMDDRMGSTGNISFYNGMIMGNTGNIGKSWEIRGILGNPGIF